MDKFQSPAFQRLLSILTGVMSGENALKSYANEDDFMKEVMKTIYGAMVDLMGLDGEDATHYLHLIVDAINELIIETTHNLSIVDIGVVPPETFQLNESTSKSESSPDTSGDIAGN